MVWKKIDGQQRSPPPQQQVEVYGGAGYQEGGGPQGGRGWAPQVEHGNYGDECDGFGGGGHGD